MAHPNQRIESLFLGDGTLQLSLVDCAFPQPLDDEIVIQVMGSPINPSDLGFLIGPAKPETASVIAGPKGLVTQLHVPEHLMPTIAARIDQPFPVGTEGCGLVVGAGASKSSRDLLGKLVAAPAGGMYARYKTARATDCLVLPEGTTASEGASCFINPLTALGMVDTMRAEGHVSLVNTAAASNLGQMLVRICEADKVQLVNIVRNTDQVALLKNIGATHVCDSSISTFYEDLVDALRKTKATIAFDAIGGGETATKLLSAMEAALSQSVNGYSRYGSTTHKQVYLYGNLDTSPTPLIRNFGLAWSVGGWLLLNFFVKCGPERVQELKRRVARELTSTFASHYSHTLSLSDILKPDNIVEFSKRKTGDKYLVSASLA